MAVGGKSVGKPTTMESLLTPSVGKAPGGHSGEAVKSEKEKRSVFHETPWPRDDSAVLVDK